ncbi:hypothetical protein MMC30_000436 [Trapelia coarctata]|nr:hypothetical protein [Trapelia coarctata]
MRPQPSERRNKVIIDMESGDGVSSDGDKADVDQPGTTMMPVHTPEGTTGKDGMIDKTPASNSSNLFGVVAWEASRLSQESQNEPEDKTKASVLSLIRNAGDESFRLVSPKLTLMPRGLAAIANLDTSEAVDSQNSTTRDADTLLRSAGPDFTSSPPSETAAAEDDVQADLDDAPDLLYVESPLAARISNGTVEAMATAAANDVDGAEDDQNSSESPTNSKRRKKGNILDGELLPAKKIKRSGTCKKKLKKGVDDQAAIGNEIQVNVDGSPSSPSAGAPREIQTANGAVEAAITVVSNNVDDDAEDIQNDAEALPNAKRRKKGSIPKEGELPHANSIEKSDGRKKKLTNSLSNAGLGSSQESMGSTIEVRIKSPGEDFPVRGASSTIGRPTSHEIKVLFGSTSTAYTQDSVKKELIKVGLRKVSNVDDCDYLCVGKSELKTSKVISAIASGKSIVTDDWATTSAKQHKLLDPTPFLASHPKHKKEWGITLADAIDLGKQGLKPLTDYLVLVTPNLKQELGSTFQEIKQIAEIGGATKVMARPPTSRDQKSTTLIVATDDDPKLVQLAQGGWRSYTKDLITMSVLRSALDLESNEFLIGKDADVGENGRGSRGRKRKR